MRTARVTSVVATLWGLILGTSAWAVITPFDFLGKAGSGMIAGNENHTINGTPGSGGEVGAGIFFDDSTNLLRINLGWGSGNGFTNLTGNATGFHIHGPTASPAPTSFTQDMGVMIFLDSLPSFNNSATSGGMINTDVSLTPTQVGYLFNGRLYINTHTSLNGGGEIRGNLVPVPEPSSLALLALALAPAVSRRSRR